MHPNKKEIISLDHLFIKTWNINSQSVSTIFNRRFWDSCCALDPGGEKLVSGGSDRNLKLWDVKSGKFLKILEGHTQKIQRCDFNHDGSKIVSCGDDDTLRIWNVQTGECLKTLKYAQPVLSCQYSPRGESILFCTGNDLYIWDGKNERKVIKTKTKVVYCTYSLDGKLIASVGLEYIEIWDALTYEPKGILKGHEASVLCCSFSPDNSRLVSGSKDNDLIVWDIENMKFLLRLKGHTAKVTSCYFADDKIISTSSDSTIRIWQANNWR